MKLAIRIITLTIFMSLFVQNSYAQQNENGWYWINSQPQGNNLNWVKIFDATHYYAVGDYGTFMRSTDAGDTWFINTKAGQPEPFFGSDGTLDLNTAWFFDANTGLVAGQTSDDSGPGKIKKTTDAGNTFTSIGIGNSPGYSSITDMYFVNSSTGFLCGNDNVSARKTTNGGLNWTAMTNLPVTTFESVYALDANTIFLGLQSDGSSRDILKSTNGGSTWTTITLPGTTGLSINDIVFQNANTGFVAAGPTYFAFTTNGGSNWIQSVFPNNQQELYEIQIIGSNVYTLGSYNSYYYTSNLGVTWDSVVFNDPTNLNQPHIFLVNSFNINANDAIVVGYNGKVNVSNDGGASWRNKNYSVSNSLYSFKSIFALPGTGHVWSGSDFGGLILHSTNNGANWTQQQTSAQYSFDDIEMLNTSTGYAVGGDPFFGAIGYCYLTTNGGNSWLNIPTVPNPTVPVFSLDFVDVNTGWIFGGYPQGGGARISKTTNGGVSWVSQVTTPFYNSTITDGEMLNANTGYCVSGEVVFKTTNGGSVWNRVNNIPELLNSSDVSVFSSTDLYVGGNKNIYKSTNSGTTWSATPISSSQANIFNMDWNDMNNGIVVGTQGYSAKTTDGGLTWTTRNTGSSTLTGVSMVGNDTVFASCDRNVYGAIFRLADPNLNITLNLNIGIQGFWNGTTQVSDTVEISLMNSVSPFNEIATTSAVLNTNGDGTFVFSSIPSGNYYIKINHRNSLETWSAAPVSVTVGGSLNYNFTTSASQAYGNNMILTSGRYCDFSGDVTQEGSVDLNDVVDVNNASSVFTTGYVVQDVTGDNLVDLSDLIITFNNASMFVTKITP